MRILIISYFYHPALTPRAFRWTAIAEHFIAQGFTVDVVCVSNIHSPANEILNGVNIHRVGGSMREVLKRWLGKESAATAAISDFKRSASVRSRLGNVLKILYGYTLRRIMWPDFAGTWYFSALKRAQRLIEEKKHDVVISVSHPFTGHMVGLMLKRRHSTKWIVDIGDPFSFMSETPVNNHRLFGRLNHYVESKILRDADGVSVTTVGTKVEYLRFFPKVESNKILVIPPLFEMPKDVEGFIPFFADPEKIRLVFTGTLYRKIRNPAALLAFFNSLLNASNGDRLELHFFGVINDCECFFEPYAELIGSRIFLHGLVPRTAAISAMKEANVLINLGNTTAYQLPSKVVEYIMLAKPVLNITRVMTDSSQNFFSDFEGVCTVTEEALSSNPAEFLRVGEFIFNPPTINQVDVERLARTHSVEAISKLYLQLAQEKELLSRIDA